jgi:hypothetical protein
MPAGLNDLRVLLRAPHLHPHLHGALGGPGRAARLRRVNAVPLPGRRAQLPVPEHQE